MAKKRPGYEYVSIPNGKGGIQETLTIQLYAPDGSVFKLPHGGDPSTYINKGYKMHADPLWNEANDTHEAEKAASLKRSNFQKDIKHREIAANQRAEDIAIEKSMQALDAEMAEKEAALETEAADLDLPGTKKKPAKAKAKK